jgi:hypothetical protein
MAADAIAAANAGHNVYVEGRTADGSSGGDNGVSARTRIAADREGDRLSSNAAPV